MAEDVGNILKTDVLVIGGGCGGCFAAIKAADAGADVTLLEKASIKRGGNTATGIHRLPIIHPDLNMTPEEFAKQTVEWGELVNEDLQYVWAKESWGVVEDLESWGIRIRQENGEFKMDSASDIIPDAPITAYPPEGQTMKPKLAKQVTNRKVRILERTMVTSLLTEDGETGTRIIGATGLNTRTNEFVVINAKAVIITTGGGYRTYRHRDTSFAPSRGISCGCPTNVGEGGVVAMRAGAEILNMELWKQSPVWKDYEHWGVGPVCFHHGSKVIDGKGNPITQSVSELVAAGHDMKSAKKHLMPIYNWLKAEHLEGKGPIHYDLTYLPEEHIKDKEIALKNECEAYYVYINARELDFRNKPIEFEIHEPYFHNSQAGISIDQHARATIEGLYAGGDVQGGAWRPSAMGAFAFGSVAGKHAAEYAQKVTLPAVDKKQVAEEKERVFMPFKQKKGVDPLEFEDKIRHLVTDYVGFLRSDAKLTRGLERLEYFRTEWLSKMIAKNNRELVRSVEVKAIMDMAEMHMRSALFRKETRIVPLSVHYNIDYPETDDENWRVHTVLTRENGKMKLSKGELRKLNTTLKEG
jgi:succinate dehydrogenase/fumarate reductase flavoprotein subunit